MSRAIFISALCLFSISAIAEQKIKLALNWKAEPQFGGFYEPSLEQNFAKIGLKLVVQEGGSGTPTIQMLANNQVDLAIVSAEEIILNNDKNPDHQVTALFATFQTNPQILMCRPENKFKSISELMSSKATVSLQAGLTYAQFLKKKYAQTKTNWVPYLGGISNFLNDKNFCQQGFFTSEPLLAKAKGVQADVFLVSKEGFNPYTTVVAVRTKDLAVLPIGKIVNALQVAWGNYLANPAVTNLKMGQLNKSMDPATFLASAKAQVELIEVSPLGQMQESRWQELIQQMTDLGLIKNHLKATDQFRKL